MYWISYINCYYEKKNIMQAESWTFLYLVYFVLTFSNFYTYFCANPSASTGFQLWTNSTNKLLEQFKQKKRNSFLSGGTSERRKKLTSYYLTINKMIGTV